MDRQLPYAYMLCVLRVPGSMLSAVGSSTGSGTVLTEASADYADTMQMHVSV